MQVENKTQSNIYFNRDFNEPLMEFAGGTTAFNINFVLFIIWKFSRIRQKLDNAKEAKTKDKFVVEITPSELCKYLKNYEFYTNEYKAKVAEKAMREILATQYRYEDDKVILRFVMLEKAQYVKESEKLIILISEPMLEMLEYSKDYYTKLNFLEQRAITTKGGKILYLLLEKNFYKRELSVSIEQIKEKWGVKVKNAELKRKIIEPAIKELKKLEKYATLKYEFIKETGGRGKPRIVGVKFDWQPHQMEFSELAEYQERNV